MPYAVARGDNVTRETNRADSEASGALVGGYLDAVDATSVHWRAPL